MRLILRFQVSDGCTYSCTETLPVEYSSAEALLEDFMAVIRRGFLSGQYPVKFLGHEFDPSAFYCRTEGSPERSDDPRYLRHGGAWFYESMPDVMTLDEFFASALLQP